MFKRPTVLIHFDVCWLIKFNGKKANGQFCKRDKTARFFSKIALNLWFFQNCLVAVLPRYQGFCNSVYPPPSAIPVSLPPLSLIVRISKTLLTPSPLCQHCFASLFQPPAPPFWSLTYFGNDSCGPGPLVNILCTTVVNICIVRLSIFVRLMSFWCSQRLIVWRAEQDLLKEQNLLQGY